MTSQASSTKERRSSPFWVNFKNSIQGTAAFPTIIFGVLMLIYPLSSFMTIRNNIKYNIMENPTYDIAKDFKYILTSEDMLMLFSTILPFLLLFAGVLLGASKFKFLLRKSTVNVYMSLGISRKNLFSSTYLAGVSQLFIAVLVPMLTVFFINIMYFGYSKKLMLSLLVLACGYFATALFGFTISSIITSAVGTPVEAIFYSLILVLLPAISFACINELMSLFLLGNEYSLAGNALVYSIGVEAPSLTNNFSYLVPTSFMSNDITYYSVLSNKDIIPQIGYGNGSGEIIKWVTPKFMASIGWIIASAVGFGAGLWTFCKRRTETAGFIGANRIVNFLITFILSFASFCLSINIFSHFLPRTASILIAVIVFIVVYMIINLILTRRIKLFVKELIMLPAHLGIALVICLFFMTGLFGYSSKQPAIADISKVDITVPGGSYIGLSASTGVSSDGSASFSNMQGYLDNITSKHDIEKVLELHKMIISDGKMSVDKKNPASSSDKAVFGNFYIKYTLKDGKKLTRYYENVKISTLVKMLELEGTDRYSTILNSIFTQPNSKKDTIKTAKLKSIIQDKSSHIYLLSKNLDIKSPLQLASQQRTELLKCIASDLQAQSIADRYMPKSETLGVIAFVSAYSDKFEDRQQYSEMVVSSQVSNEDGDGKNLPPELTTDMLLSLSVAGYSGTSQYNVFITQDMKNTVKFLEDNALLKQLDNDTKIVSAEIIDRTAYSINRPWTLSDNSGTSYQFMGGRTPSEFIKENSNDFYSTFRQSYKLSDADTIAGLYKNSYFNYYSPIGGYFVRYTLNDGDKTVMFIPDDKVPNNIKESISKIDFSKDQFKN
ncbi:MAG: hypothetical protein RR343_01225 [Oscillospiraceae bacterium]